MAMTLYGVSVAVLAEQLKQEFPSPIYVLYAYYFSTTASRRATRPLMTFLFFL